MNKDSGLVLLDKPAGLTSFAALGAVKRALPGVRVGHTGTLDSFATGLLVALTGGCTRLAQWFTLLDKEYSAVVRFGAETSTLDPEGEVVGTSGIPDRSEVERCIPGFTGTVMQAPPAISAIHVDGERAWKRARRGEAPVMKERPVRIDSIVMEEFEGSDLRIRVRCSSGTYIRSLARDLAAASGARAHLVGLRRLAVGPFRVEDSGSPDAFRVSPVIRPFGREAAEALGFRTVMLGPGKARDFLNGRPVVFEGTAGEESGADTMRGFAAFDEAGGFLGLARRGDKGIEYLAVMPS